MSAEQLNKVVERLSTDHDFHEKVENAIQGPPEKHRETAQNLFGEYDLSAEERDALMSKDHARLQSLGLKGDMLQRMEWCTGYTVA